MAITSEKVKGTFGLPLVYVLESCPAYLRQRLIEKGVFFVVSDKFAFLPTLIANERIRVAPEAERLTPVAQYLLLYHLQVKNLDGMSAKEISSYVPYSYSSVTLGLVCLDDLGFIKGMPTAPKERSYSSPLPGKPFMTWLWNICKTQ